MSCDRPARRLGNVLRQTSASHSCHVAVLTPPVLRSIVLLVLLASSLVQSAAVHRRKELDPVKRRLVNGHLETWQVAACRQREHYVACFLCGKIVQSRDVYYACCHMDPTVLRFCNQLLE